VPAGAQGAPIAGHARLASSGTRDQVAWVRRSATNFVKDELQGNGAGACSVLYAPLQATEGHRTCARRWDVRLAAMLRTPGERARLRAQLRAIRSVTVTVRRDTATLHLATPLMQRASRLLWTSNCWMLES
jgi:hypothetical protein